MQNGKIRNPGTNDDDNDTDEKRMIVSGAEEAGYHPPSREDINDIRKDHNAATTGITADEAIRRAHGTAEVGVDDEAVKDPSEGVERGDDVNAA
jgi:hypothetical protein